jgi:hypothetical protein
MSGEVRDPEGNSWLHLFRARQDVPTEAMAVCLRQMWHPVEDTDITGCYEGRELRPLEAITLYSKPGQPIAPHKPEKSLYFAE